MNVRIFWVRAMKCMCAQTRPRFILSSERVFGGMEFEPMLTPREKSPLPEKVPRGGSNPRHCGQRAQALPTSYSGPYLCFHFLCFHCLCCCCLFFVFISFCFFAFIIFAFVGNLCSYGLSFHPLCVHRLLFSLFFHHTCSFSCIFFFLLLWNICSAARVFAKKLWICSLLFFLFFCAQVIL